MKFNVYSIRDTATGFLTPTVEVNDAVAMRNFEHAVLNGDSVLFSHAKNFDLFRIGRFDSDSGSLEPEYPAVLICSGDSVLRKE